MLVASIGMSWVAVQVHRLIRQRELITRIREGGGEVYYDYQRESQDSGAPERPLGPAWLRAWVGDDVFAKVDTFYGSTSFGDESMPYVGQLDDLKKVELLNTQTTDVGLLHLQGLTKLQDLCVGHSERIGGSGLQHIRAIVTLKSVDLGGSRVTDDALEHLIGLTNLESVDLRSCKGVHGSGLAYLAALPRLRDLYLSNTSIDDHALEHVAQMAQLESLDLSWTNVAGSGLIHLTALAHLRRLDLACCKVTGGLQHLTALTSLRVLDLVNVRVSESELQHLSGLTGLRELRIGGVYRHVTDEEVKKLQEALPNCWIRW